MNFQKLWQPCSQAQTQTLLTLLSIIPKYWLSCVAVSWCVQLLQLLQESFVVLELYNNLIRYLVNKNDISWANLFRRIRITTQFLIFLHLSVLASHAMEVFRSLDAARRGVHVFVALEFVFNLSYSIYSILYLDFCIIEECFRFLYYSIYFRV